MRIKKLNCITLIAISCLSTLAFSNHHAMSPAAAKIFYRQAFKHTVENMHATKRDYQKYFSKDFVMNINGKRYHFDDYVRLMQNLRKDTASVRINFNDMVAENGNVATVHTTHVKKVNGEEISLQVQSLFKIRNHRFVSGNELTVTNLGQATRKA